MTLMTEKPVTSTFSTPQLSRLNVALAPLHQEYDSADRSLRKPFSSPGYHTTLKGGEVHPTRESLEYAVAILDVVNPDLQTRSEEIVRRIVAEQDQDSESKTYGIWSWFLDEPLTQMSPPDWNWADFCGVQLLQIALFHRDRFDSDTMKLIDTAIVHAARSIERRNVGPHYTNIAVMGTYVTLIAAQLYDLDDLKTYALNRLKRFHEYTQYNGGFSEFNSPTYTTVVLKELGRLRRDVRLAEARDLVEDLYTAAWEEIAVHFHVPTRQWGGPHSRWYRSLMDDATLGLIERSVRRPLHWGKVSTFPSIEEHRLLLPCPQHLESHFAEVGEARQIVKTFQRDTPLLVGTTFLTPHFTLGSITLNKGVGVFVRNFYLPLIDPECPEKRLLKIGKVCTLLFGAIIVLMALIVAKYRSVGLFDLMNQLAASIALPMMFPMVYGLFYKRTPGWSGWSTVIVGFLSSLAVKYFVPPEAFARLFGFSGHLNADEATYALLFATVLIGTVTCTVWYFSTSLFYATSDVKQRESIDRFFINLNTPIEGTTATAADDGEQMYVMLGQLCLVYGAFVFLLILIPNDIAGRACFLFCGGIIFTAGAILRRLGQRYRRVASEEPQLQRMQLA